MESDLARKRKLSASGRPGQGETAPTGTGQTAYYSSTNPSAASLENFVSSVSETALSNSTHDFDDRAARPVKKKRANEGESADLDSGKHKPSSSAAAQPNGRPSTTTGSNLFPVRRAESVLLTVNAGSSAAGRSKAHEVDSDNEADASHSANPENRGRSASTVRAPPASGKARSKPGEDEDGDRGYSLAAGGRGGREGSVSFSGNEGATSGKKGKRNRVHFSCVECHRRKQKCDRGEPCGQCIARKVPNLCRPFINGVEDPAVHEADIKARLSRIEDILSTLITRLPTKNDGNEGSSENSHGNTSQAAGQTTHNSHLHPQHAQQHSSQSGHTAYHQRPIAPAPPSAVTARNRMRSNGSRTPVPGSVEDSGNGYQRVDLDVRAMLSGGPAEEVFHPKAHDSNSQTSSPAANQTHTPPVPLYYSNVHAAGSPSDGPSPASGAIIEHPKLKARITLDPPSPDLTEILHTLSESGITKNVLISLLMSVPEKGLCDNLVELYFREIDWTRYKINRPAFHRKYAQFFESMKSYPTNPPLNGDMLKWLPLMFIVLAIATLSAPLELVGGLAGQKSWSRRFYGSSRSALTCAKALQRDNLDVLYAGLLTARYMLLTRRAAEGSTPLTAAFQLGLYRDGTVLNLTDKREIELRRRAWAMVYHLDRTTALLVGRPTSISDAHTDTKEPANLDDEEVDSGDFDPKGHSLMHPTEYTQVILRHRLAEIMGRISDHTFAIRPPDYATVLKLDQELLDWQSKLPPFFAIHHPDTSLDANHHFLFVQRHLLACEFLFARITLHRPYLLRKRTSDKQYQYSRDAAIESAKADLLGRREFMFEKPQNVKINSGGYRVLNSYIVLGVTIKLDAASPRAEELRRLLDVVAGLAPDEQGRISEPIVKDELAIVEFLTQRANNTSAQEQALNNSAAIPPYSHVLSSRANNAGQRFGQQQKQSNRSDIQNPDRKLSVSSHPSLKSPQQIRRHGQDSNQYSEAPQAAPEDSAWSFVAPDLNTIDVHQPFIDSGRGMTETRMPGPLRGPARPRQNSLLEQAYMDSASYQPRSNDNPERNLLLEDAEQHAGLQAYDNQFSSEVDLSGSNATNLDAWWNDTFGQLPTNAGGSADTGFNPFYLSQLGQGSDTVSENSETDFLNILLSTIANNSTLGTGA